MRISLEPLPTKTITGEKLGDNDGGSLDYVGLKRVPCGMGFTESRT
jgi:hypothetical protein